MANLSDFVGFALTVTIRYKKETRVESSFSTAPLDESQSMTMAVV